MVRVSECSKVPVFYGLLANFDLPDNLDEGCLPDDGD
jgi:hypothetical protein